MRLSLALLFTLLAACSGLPKEMRNMPYVNIGLNEVKANPTSYKGMPFRWGGTVIDITNKENSSQAQILYYPISSYGRPRIDKAAEGRFAISRAQFLDPAIFKEGIEVTVTGILSGEIKQKIGDKNLSLPLLNVDHIHIWPRRQQFDDRFQFYPYSPLYPFYYSPFPYYRNNFYYNNF